MTYVPPHRLKTVETTRKPKKMNSRARCSVCKQYVPQAEIFFANRMTKVCSSECFGALMGKQRAAKKQQAPTGKPRARRRMQPVIPIEIRAQIHSRDHGLCQCCGKKGTQVHHVLFRSQGGKEDLSNLILLCNQCHQEHAHGEHARVYRALYRRCIWLRMVENTAVFAETDLPAESREFLGLLAVPDPETKPGLQVAS